MSMRGFAVTGPVAIAATPDRAGRRGRAALRRRYAGNMAILLLYAVMLVWTFTPIYNIVMIALEQEGDVYGNSIVPTQPSLDSFWVVITQGYWYLE
ncbi:MAG: hypothetical protein ACM3MF_11555, partial [Anaerolineae bacterium]